MAQFYAAYIYGYYLGDWDNAISFADQVSTGKANDKSSIYLLYAFDAIIENDFNQAQNYADLVSRQLSKFTVANNIALTCTLKPEADFTELIQTAKYCEIGTKEKYSDYVKFRNFHPSVTDIYLSDKVLENCPVFTD